MKKHQHKLIFIVFLLLISFAYGYFQILPLKPYSIHQWRQADCVSFADNYYNNGLNFFEPAVNWIGPEGHGKTVSEFPVIYYSVAVLWKIFGKSEMIFRLINLLIAFTGLYYLFKLSKEILKDNFWSFFIPLFLFSSPIYVYYANNFLADVPALSIVFIAWYYSWKYYQDGNVKWMYVAVLLFGLAGLLKITSMLSFVALLLALFIYQFKNKHPESGFRWNKHVFISIAIIFIIVFSWYTVAMQYNNQHNRGLFLQGILPIWELDSSDKIKEIGIKLYNEILPSFFNITGLHIVLLLFIFCLISYRKMNRFAFYLVTAIFAGVLIYIVLFYKVFDVHDYYLVNMLVFIPATIFVFIHFLKEKQASLFESKSLKQVSFVLLLCSIYYTAVHTRIKYDSNHWLVKKSFIISKTQQDYWNWYHWDYNEHYRALETITPYLRSIGIKREDKVISMPDQSINISLYLMDQTGFTDFGYAPLQDSARIEKFKFLGAKFLIVNNKSSYENMNLKKYFINKIGSYKNVDIYKL